MELTAPAPITGMFVLAADVVLMPLTDMDEDERLRLGGSPGDVVLTRLDGRVRSKLVDPQTARLAERFRAPSAIVAAVIAESQCTGADPEATLERAYPMFAQLIGSGFLVPEGSPDARRIEPELVPGSTWRGMEVIRVIQALDDVDVYQARTPMGIVALKRARTGATKAAAALKREAEILRLLDGRGAPKLLLEFDDPAALAIDWCDGVDADHAAARLRALPRAQSRPALLDLCRSVAAAYATLHQHGVVHGDVHPRNVLVTADGTTHLIDFGLATAAPHANLLHAQRAGAGYFFEPEYARARLKDEPHPPATARSEQHIVGHLLYRLVTGHGYLDFPAGEEEAMRALATGIPKSFERWGLAPWDAMERVLGRALACDAESRYDDMTAFNAALASVEVPAEPDTRGRTACTGIESVLARLDPDGRLFAAPLPSVPRCSVTFGSAGVALFLQRLAAARDSPELLSWSKLWIEKAVSDAALCGDDAYFLPAAGLRPEVVGRASVQHTATGLHAVRAMIARAMGDVADERRAADTFGRDATGHVEPLDVAFGRAGLLLTWALLREGGPPMPSGVADDIGSRLAGGLVADIASQPALRLAAGFPFAGMAHGWAGVLYSLLAWSQVSGVDFPDTAADRLAELATQAEPVGAGVHWPIHVAGAGRGRDHMRGWCNGSAGMVFLFTQAARTLDEPRYLELAERVGRDACSELGDAGYMCCGDVGQAYAALALHRATREAKWLTFAEQVAVRYAAPEAVPDARFAYSLIKGPLGGQLLAAELDAAPDEARMPLFELAGWV